MASVYKKQGRWWIHVRDGTGRWRDISTKADTKTAAKRMAQELEHKAERQRRGLEPFHDPSRRVSLGQVMDIWWAKYGKELKSTTIHVFSEKHFRKELGALALIELTSGKLDSFFRKKQDILAPRSVNHLRSHMRRLFNIAKKEHLWVGENPVNGDVDKAVVQNDLVEYLRLHEVPRVLTALPARWRPLFATAVYTGLRRGELLALRKTDVDLEAKTMKVSRSHGNDTTKGKHANLLPIADDLVPYLRTAINESSSDLVFPAAHGGRQRHDVKLQKVLRRAMAVAGIVVGFDHRCRGRKCRFEERRTNAVESQCPRCSKTLWVRPVPRPVRFHDLRHTTATLLLKADVPLATVQKVLRHTDCCLPRSLIGCSPRLFLTAMAHFPALSACGNRA